jgi:predicted dienelactone hydrolase
MVVIATSVSAGAGAAVRSRATAVVSGDTVVKVTKLTPKSFTRNGPYRVGLTTFSLSVPPTSATPAGYTTTAVCWYPTNAKGATSLYNLKDELPPAIDYIVSQTPSAANAATSSTGGIPHAAIAPGTFPLVLFSHGYSGFKWQSSTLMSHLASWGFVVCAPDHPGRDLEALLDSQVGATPPTTDPNADVTDLIALHAFVASGGVRALGTHVDANHVVVIGHSAGGSAAERLASWGTTQPVNWVKGWIGMAGMSNLAWSTTVAPFNAMPTEPGLVLAGDNDHVVPAATLQAGFAALTGPKYFAELLGAGHDVYSDICVIGAGDGGILAIAAALKVPVPPTLATLASDGCHAPNQPVTSSWPVINEMTVAATRYFLGIDKSTIGFTNLHASFPTTLH